MISNFVKVSTGVMVAAASMALTLTSTSFAAFVVGFVPVMVAMYVRGMFAKKVA